MRLNKAQWCWLLYDPGNAAFAMLVRAVFGPLLFIAYSECVLSQSQATANWGVLCSVAGVVAGVCSLYCGALVDANGKRKLALGISTFIGVAATLALAFCRGHYGVMICYFIALAAYMVSNSFYDSLLISVAQESEFNKLSTLAYGFGYLGGFLPFLIILFAGYFIIEDMVLTAKSAFVFAAVWWALFTLPLLFAVKEKTGCRRKVRWFEGFAELYRNLREIFRNRNARLFLIAYFLYIDGVSTILLMAAPISLEIGMDQTWLMLIMLGLQVIGFPATVGMGFLAGRFGARKVVYFLLAIYVTVAGLIWELTEISSTQSKWWIFLTAAGLIGLAQGGIQALSRALFGKLIPAEKSAEFFSVYNIFGKFTTILGPVLIYLASSFFQRSEYGIVMLIVPFTLGGWLLSRVDFSARNK